MTRAALVLVAVTCFGPAPAGRPAPAQEPVFRSSVEVVRVDALVTDGHRPIAGLTARDFELRDEGVLQEIASVTTTDSAHLVLALDLSDSVRGAKLRALTEAATAVRAHVTDRDELTVVNFAESFWFPAGGTLLDDPRRAKAGATGLHDAIFAALVQATRDPRPALLLLMTDGLDNASWLPRRDVIDTARRADVVIYPVGVNLREMRRDSALADGPRFMDELAAATGGRVFDASAPAGLTRAVVEAIDEYRKHYVIAYTPAQASPGWHRVTLSVKGRRAHVEARPGYWVGKR
ncbi:MAG: hypothetical protein U0Q12_25650 [Vicinamibacterales bacterium]